MSSRHFTVSFFFYSFIKIRGICVYIDINSVNLDSENYLTSFNKKNLQNKHKVHNNIKHIADTNERPSVQGPQTKKNWFSRS